MGMSAGGGASSSAEEETSASPAKDGTGLSRSSSGTKASNVFCVGTTPAGAAGSSGWRSAAAASGRGMSAAAKSSVPDAKMRQQTHEKVLT